MTTTNPLPIEIALDQGLILRGLEYQGDGPPVVLIHGLGDDADSWGEVPRILVSRGFRVISVELRGHGLSDGEPDSTATMEDIKAAIAEISESFGPVAVVACEAAATACLTLGGDDGSPVQVLISPVDAPGFDPRDSVPAMRAIIAGTKDDEADSFIRSVYPRLLGQNMWFSTGVSDRGVALVVSQPQLLDQLVMFIRRYLIGYHLAWIADVRASQEAGSEAEQAGDGGAAERD